MDAIKLKVTYMSVVCELCCICIRWQRLCDGEREIKYRRLMREEVIGLRNKIHKLETSVLEHHHDSEILLFFLFDHA